MSAPAKNFTELVVWQKAHAFVLNIYKQTAKLLNRYRTIILSSNSNS